MLALDGREGLTHKYFGRQDRFAIKPSISQKIILKRKKYIITNSRMYLHKSFRTNKRRKTVDMMSNQNGKEIRRRGCTITQIHKKGGKLKIEEDVGKSYCLVEELD